MTASETAFSSEARVATTLSQRYLAQLCKHFEHKLPVTLELEHAHGRIEFPAGVCALDAATAPDTLIMRVASADAAALPGLEDVVARHLERFAFRDKPAIVWTRIERA